MGSIRIGDPCYLLGCEAPLDTLIPRRSGPAGSAVVANVYVEPRPKGRSEGTRIDDYVIEDHADHVLVTTKTQHEAISWAKQHGHHPFVARVRHLNDKSKPDHWRSA